ERAVPVVSRMHFEDVARSLMEPRDQNDFLSGSNTVQPFSNVGGHPDPGVRRTFESLFGGVFPTLERRPDESDWLPGITLVHHGDSSRERYQSAARGPLGRPIAVCLEQARGALV